MPDDSARSVRVEFAFEGGQLLIVLVTDEEAEAIDRALAASSQGTLKLETSEGLVTVVVPKVVYVKRYSAPAPPGFGG